METTARWNLPLIEPGQAQKELFHNEALVLLDAGMQASIVAAGIDVPPSNPLPGQCWIVGPAPSGSWAGQAFSIACHTVGGWRFIAPKEGLAVWHAAQRRMWRYGNGQWEAGVLRASRMLVDGQQVVGARRDAIAAPSGGAVVDVEVRTAFAGVLDALRAHGLIAT